MTVAAAAALLVAASAAAGATNAAPAVPDEREFDARAVLGIQPTGADVAQRPAKQQFTFTIPGARYPSFTLVRLTIEVAANGPGLKPKPRLRVRNARGVPARVAVLSSVMRAGKTTFVATVAVVRDGRGKPARTGANSGPLRVSVRTSSPLKRFGVETEHLWPGDVRGGDGGFCLFNRPERSKLARAARLLAGALAAGLRVPPALTAVAKTSCGVATARAARLLGIAPGTSSGGATPGDADGPPSSGGQPDSPGSSNPGSPPPSCDALASDLLGNGLTHVIALGCDDPFTGLEVSPPSAGNPWTSADADDGGSCSIASGVASCTWLPGIGTTIVTLTSASDAGTSTVQATVSGLPGGQEQLPIQLGGS